MLSKRLIISSSINRMTWYDDLTEVFFSHVNTLEELTTLLHSLNTKDQVESDEFNQSKDKEMET